MSSTDVMKLRHALHVYVAVTLCHAPLPSHCRQGLCIYTGWLAVCAINNQAAAWLYL